MFVPNKYFSLVYYLLLWTKDYLSGENATACGPTLSLLANIRFKQSTLISRSINNEEKRSFTALTQSRAKFVSCVFRFFDKFDIVLFFVLKIVSKRKKVAFQAQLSIHNFIFLLLIKSSSGLCFKPMTIVNEDSWVVNKLETSLTDDARVIIYNCHMFIVQVTGELGLGSKNWLKI
jgi:hypothetical protein